MKRLTPILLVDSIESCLDFWQGIGFEISMQVPEGERLGFVALTSGPTEIMLQTRSGVAQDLPALAKEPNQAFLYLQTDRLDEIEEIVADREVVAPRRKTFYGAEELGVRGPAGNVILFAEFASEEAKGETPE